MLSNCRTALRTVPHFVALVTRTSNKEESMATVETENVVIVGSGPAGLTAAIYAARAGLSPVVICGADAGGQLMTTSGVENYPGFSKAIAGPKLMEEMLAQATHCGAKLLSEDVDAIDAESKPIAVS